jgi:hypothetical protein
MFGRRRASTKTVVRFLVFPMLFGSIGFAGTETREIVRKSIDNYERDWRAGMSWAYTQTDVTQGDGTKEIEISEVAPLEGTPYERLMAKDGRPLTEEERRKEDHKFEKAEKQREKESPAEREARIRKYESERAFVKELPDAYNFKSLGEEILNGRPTLVIEMTPRPGFVPVLPHAAMLEHIQGKLWIDKEDVQWAKAEAHVTDTITIGWIVARIGPGARFTVEQTRVADGLWMPKHITISGVARVMMVHSKKLNEELTFSGYREVAENAQNRPTRQKPPTGSRAFQ